MPRAGLVGALVLFGACWGATQPFNRIAVSTGHGALGLVFWQAAIGFVLMRAILLLRGRPMPMGAAQIRVFVLLALLGTIVPGLASYTAVAHLPAGVLSILLSFVPMMAFPVALMLGLDRFGWRRLAGLVLGLGGVSLLVVPDASLPAAGQSLWVMVAMIAGICYAFEGNVVARWGLAGMGPMQTLCGVSAVAALLSAPVALASGQWVSPLPFGAPEMALTASASLQVAGYTGYVWLVSKAGSVFAVQISYLVTGFGVLFAMTFLNEGYSGWIWAALALMMAGLFLVQPKPAAPVRA